MLALLLLGVLILVLYVQPAKRVFSLTITVPDEYSTIQEAINVASSGGTIFIKNGTYNENVIVNTTVSLIGESVEGTIVDGQNTSDTISLTADNVEITNLTVTNSNGTYPNSGIFLNHVENSIVTGNNVSGNNGHGIFVMWGTNNFIVNNVVTHNAKPGIRVDGSNAPAKVVNNTVGYNQEDGIFLYSVIDVLVEDNTILDNVYNGISPQGGSNNTSIRRNLIMSNGWHGIFIATSSNDSISDNNVRLNSQDGIQLYVSSNCDIYGNNITENSWDGIFSDNASDNKIYHNDVIGNGWHQASIGSTGSSLHNVWNDGYPSGGNYWSDYAGTDSNSDGIGDTPYTIDASNQDRYPLVNPWPQAPQAASQAIHLLLTLEPNQATNTRRQSITLTISVFNKLSRSLNSTLILTVTGPEIYYMNFQSINVTADTVGEYSFAWDIPNASGTYVVEVSLIPPLLTAYDAVWLEVA